MSRYERMDCIKRSMMPVRYKKIGSGETYLLLEALFFTSPEPVDKKRKKQSTGLEYGNVTYQETRKRCEQIIWTKENNLEPNIGNNQRIANDYLSPAHTNIRNNYR